MYASYYLRDDYLKFKIIGKIISNHPKITFHIPNINKKKC